MRTYIPAARSIATLQQLPRLFFGTKQLIRTKLPHTHDPNEWMRCEILRFIHSSSSAPTMREVAKYLQVKAPSATSLIMRLERERLLTRVKSKNDRRVVSLTLTQKGLRRMNKYVGEATRTMGRVFAKLPSRDVEELARILQLLTDTHRE